MEKSLSKEESLSIVTAMLNRSRNNIRESAIYYLIWGWAIFAAAIAEFVAIQFFNYSYHWLVWPIVIPITAIAAGITGRRAGKQKGYTTFIDKSMINLWAGFGLFMIFLVIMSATTIGWTHGYQLMIALIGLGTFASGGILRFTPLKVGGLFSFGLALLPLFLPANLVGFKLVLILFAISIFTAYLIPGYLLKSRK